MSVSRVPLCDHVDKCVRDSVSLAESAQNRCEPWRIHIQQTPPADRQPMEAESLPQASEQPAPLVVTHSLPVGGQEAEPLPPSSW